jgi:hypothetical protein
MDYIFLFELTNNLILKSNVKVLNKASDVSFANVLSNEFGLFLLSKKKFLSVFSLK